MEVIERNSVHFIELSEALTNPCGAFSPGAGIQHPVILTIAISF